MLPLFRNFIYKSQTAAHWTNALTVWMLTLGYFVYTHIQTLH